MTRCEDIENIQISYATFPPDEMAQTTQWAGSPRIKGFSNMHRMAMLTFSLIGLQFTWGVEMTYFTPYLLKLGLAKSQTSLVWIAPPLSGLIIQPIIGTVSDSSKLRWGRRRPYMLICSIIVALNLLTLGWAAEIIGLFFTNQSFIERGTVTLAIFCIYAVDFAINAVQATCRSLIVDTLPTSEQQAGSAWAGRMLGFGHVLGYFAGTLDMSKIFGTLIGDTQFKQVCVLASVVIVFCVGTTCFCVEERVLLSQRDDGTHSGSGAWKMLTTILKTTLHLPRKIRAVCWITFWCWIGWSPFFVYGTTWVGETYYREDESRASELRGAVDPVGLLARKGSGALFLFSLISLAGSIMLPWFVESPEGDDHSSDPKKDSEGFLSTLRRYRIDITTAWGLSQVLFGFAMLLAPISHSFQFATTLIALCGLPWAMYGWAPLAIMGEEINKLESAANTQTAYTTITQDGEETELSRPGSLDLSHDDNTLVEGQGDSVGVAGVYLGIWNIFATIPQFIATFIAMITFAILEPGKNSELTGGPGGPDGGDGADKVIAQGLSGTAVCLAIGAVCSLVAATQSFRLRKY